MIPNGVSGEPLRLFFTEHLFVSLVFGWDPSDGCHRDLFRMKDDSSKEIIGCSLLSGNIPLSGYKDGSSCIVGTQYHGDLIMVNPSSFPSYFRFHGGNPS